MNVSAAPIAEIAACLVLFGAGISLIALARRLSRETP